MFVVRLSRSLKTEDSRLKTRVKIIETTTQIYYYNIHAAFRIYLI